MKIKVIEVITDTNIGGAGRLLLCRLRQTDRETFEETVVIPQGSALTQCIDELGINCIPMNCCFDRSFDIRGIFHLYKIFKTHSVDIVNAHGCLSARIAAYLAKVPVKIYTRHCAFKPRFLMTVFPLKNINGFITRKLNDKIIAVADAAAENLKQMGVREDMIKVIINGVMPIERYESERKRLTRKELGVPEDAFVCGMSARLEECKGIDTLLRAAQRLLLNDKNYYFMILGSGSCEKSLKELCARLCISDKVKFFGFVSDITPYINCFDLVVNCSRGTETSSLALSEGMSISLPCVASDWGGNPYMVFDGVNGLVFRTDNYLQLTSKIEYMKNNDAEYRRMAENAYFRFKNELNAENMARKTEEFYSSLFLAKGCRLSEGNIIRDKLN